MSVETSIRLCIKKSQNDTDFSDEKQKLSFAKSLASYQGKVKNIEIKIDQLDEFLRNLL